MQQSSKHMVALAALATLSLVACNKPTPQPPAAAPPPVAVAVAPIPTAGPVNPVMAVTTYVCSDTQTVVAGYPDPQTAIVTWKDHTYTLKLASAASGTRYTGYGLQWWTTGLTAGTLAPLKPGEEIASTTGVACVAKTPGDVVPPPPGAPGGLAADGTPISEAPFTATSAQGAANVVQTYYALIEQKKYADAAALRSDGKSADFSLYSSYHAQVGAPGKIEGAAGSLYVDVPVVIYGRFEAGHEVHQSGKVTLRRVNDVPGSSAAQRLWRIERITLK